jgi:hypothetical protein
MLSRGWASELSYVQKALQMADSRGPMSANSKLAVLAGGGPWSIDSVLDMRST